MDVPSPPFLPSSSWVCSIRHHPYFLPSWQTQQWWNKRMDITPLFLNFSVFRLGSSNPPPSFLPSFLPSLLLVTYAAKQRWLLLQPKGCFSLQQTFTFFLSSSFDNFINRLSYVCQWMSWKTLSGGNAQHAHSLDLVILLQYRFAYAFRKEEKASTGNAIQMPMS